MPEWGLWLLILVLVGGVLYLVWRGRRRRSRAGTPGDTTGTAYAKSEGAESAGHDSSGGGGDGGGGGGGD